MTILLIVESPGKVAKISSILGNEYLVQATKGIFRDLDNKSMSIDFENNYEPIYVIHNPTVVKNLRMSMKSCQQAYIATDMDREGEGIAQSVLDTLKPKKYFRILFNSITPEAIMNGIENKGTINSHLVDSQKSRRILDRLFGYIISPFLQKQMGKSLSAGRVQSVVVKLIIEKENKIRQMIDENKTSYYEMTGTLSNLNCTLMTTEKPSKNKYIGSKHSVDSHKDAIAILKKCKTSTYHIHAVDSVPVQHKPSPPYITSSLQQDAHQKLGFNVGHVMQLAQKLYERGKITYMRTDSTEISKDGHQKIKEVIEDMYGKDNYERRSNKTKVANSQEAHEAIRPTQPDKQILDGAYSKDEIALYQLIWKRTIASQMKAATFDKMIIQIDISHYVKGKPVYYFESIHEQLVDPGFMLVYQQKEKKVPKIKFRVGDEVDPELIIATEKFGKLPSRYHEASIIKKMEKLSIGRPSTYASIIQTIKKRGYVMEDNVAGILKNINIYSIDFSQEPLQIELEQKEIKYGEEKNKLVPTPLGIRVNDILITNFTDFMDYQFTSLMEKQLDEIAHGNQKWSIIIDDFYQKLKSIIDGLQINKINNSDILIGKDDDNREIYQTCTKYGPVIYKTWGKKRFYKNLPKDTTNGISLEEAQELFQYPITLGNHQKKEVILDQDNYGFYVFYDNNRFNVAEEVDLESAIKAIEGRKIMKTKSGATVEVMIGKYGPYLKCIKGKNKFNQSIPKKYEIDNLTEKDIEEIMAIQKRPYQKTIRKK